MFLNVLKAVCKNILQHAQNCVLKQILIMSLKTQLLVVQK